MHGVVGLIATLATAVVILRAWEAPRALVAALVCLGGLGTGLYALEVTRQPGAPGNVASATMEASLWSPPTPQGTWIEVGPIVVAAHRRAHVADAGGRP